MRIAVIGSGIIGEVIARDLASWDTPDDVVVADLNAASAERVAASLGFEPATVDVRDADSLGELLGSVDVALNAAQYEVNLDVMRGCLAAGCHYVDLGGLFHTTRKQLELSEAFEAAGLTAVLGIGSCPGIANVHAGDGAARLDTVESVIIYNGATVDLSGSLAWPYSLWTILEEIVERPMVFRDGEFVDVEPLSEEEMFPFKEPIGNAKTHLSLHSEVATIPLSLADKGIKSCEFKIRFFGFPEAALRKFQFLSSIGLASTKPRTVGGVEGVVPRRLLVDLMEETKPPKPEHEGYKDIATVIKGTRDGAATTIRFDTTSWPSEELGVAGGTAVVASPAAVTARWLASGFVDRPGVHPPEVALPPAPFYEELAKRRMETTMSEEIRLA